MSDSYIHNGLVLNKTFINPDWECEKDTPRLLMLDGGLDGFNYEDVQMQINDPSQLAEIREQEMHILGGLAQAIGDVCDVLVVRDGVHEAVAKYLDAKGVGVVSRVQQSDYDAIARVTESNVYHRFDFDDKECVGKEINGQILSKRIGDLDYVAVEVDKSDTVTIIIRGATRQTLDEYERAFDDAIGVTCLFHNNNNAYPGGGAVLSKLSLVVREYATNEKGLTSRERMCMEAFADSLEIIPAAIASNAGMDALDIVMELRSCEDDMGLYIDFNGEGRIDYTGVMNVMEPASLVKQIITSATEVCCSILRIDDIIARRGQ